MFFPSCLQPPTDDRGPALPNPTNATQLPTTIASPLGVMVMLMLLVMNDNTHPCVHIHARCTTGGRYHYDVTGACATPQHPL